MHLQTLIQQANKVFSESPWYGKGVLELLKEVDPETVNDIPPGQTHSIGQIVMHMIAWKQYLIEKGAGNSTFKIEMDSAEDWLDPEQAVQWPELLGNLKATHASFMNLLRANDDEWLSSKVPLTDFSFGEIVQGIIHHDIYHLGQLAVFIKSFA